ncbi:MAG TPA: hypothetical protein VFI11_15320 [Anaerolineales bacterium]|nr:hypothetical protein [Anaerolineales bacterium]
MFAGFAKVLAAIVVCAIGGAAFGLLIGSMAENYLLWVGISAAIGAAFGMAIGYGLLPES